MRFSEEELALAKSVDLCDVATALGYTVKRIGRYHTLKEMDSIRIYNRSHWFRWSRQYEAGNNGGSQIDFLRVFAGMEVKEAVFWLLDFAGYQKGMDIPKVEMPKEKPKEIKEFVLPEANENNDKIISYLVNQRGLSKETVDYFISQGLLYESKQYHNIVFLGNDKEGVTRFASMRGIYDKGGKLEEYQRDMEAAKRDFEKPFEHAEELEQKLKRQFELNTELDLENKSVDDVDLSESKDVSKVAEKTDNYDAKRK